MVLRWAVAPAMTIALLTGGCSSSAETATRQPGAGSSKGGRQEGTKGTRSVYGPIRDVMQAGTDWVTAESAVDRQVNAAWGRCLKDEGYVVTPPMRSRAQLVTDGYTVAYGTDLADPQQRTKEGYGVTGGLVGIRSAAEQSNSISSYIKGLSEAERDAFSTTLQTCGDQAHKQVLPTETLDELNAATRELSARIQSDQRLVDARAAWVRCMKDAGFSFREPEEPPGHFDDRARPLYDSLTEGVVTPAARRLHAEELKTAAADWTCREKTITPALFTVRGEVESAFLEEHPELAERVRQEMKEVIARG